MKNTHCTFSVAMHMIQGNKLTEAVFVWHTALIGVIACLYWPVCPWVGPPFLEFSFSKCKSGIN